MARITKSDIANMFHGGTMTASEIIGGLAAAAREVGKNEAIVTPVPSIRYMGKESITEGSVNTLMMGVHHRLVNVPSDVSTVVLYYGTDLNQHVTLNVKDGKYSMQPDS